MFYIAFLPIVTPTRINKYVSHSRPGGSENHLNLHTGTNGSNVLVSVHYLVLWPMMISYLVPVGLPGTRFSYSVRIWFSDRSTRYSVFLPRTDTGIRVGSANTQENASCAFSVAGVGLQDLANLANRTDINKRIANENMNVTAGNYNGTFCTRE